MESCRRLVKDKDFIVLDTETTGLKNDDEIIQLAVLEPRTMKPLIDTRVKPTKSIAKEATAVHGLTNHDVLDAPTFDKLYPELETIFNRSSQVVIYNAAYDIRMLSQSRKPYGLPPFSIETDPSRVTCAMEIFSSYVGDWNGRKGDFQWQKLPLAQHRPIQDCISTLNVLRRMAVGEESIFIADMLCKCGHLKGL